MCKYVCHNAQPVTYCSKSHNADIRGLSHDQTLLTVTAQLNNVNRRANLYVGMPMSVSMYVNVCHSAQAVTYCSKSHNADIRGLSHDQTVLTVTARLNNVKRRANIRSYVQSFSHITVTNALTTSRSHDHTVQTSTAQCQQVCKYRVRQKSIS